MTVWLQLDVRLRDRDSRWHCERSWTMTLAEGAVEFFFIDTSSMVQKYREVVWAVNRGARKSPTAAHAISDVSPVLWAAGTSCQVLVQAKQTSANDGVWDVHQVCFP